MSPKTMTTGKPTDDVLADRFCREHPDTAFGLGSFRRYEHGFWRKIPEVQVKQEILRILEKSRDEDIRTTNYLVSSVFEIVKIKLTIYDEKWDANPDIIVLANGTYEISNLLLRPHSPYDCVTYALPFAYDLNAKALYWEKFLSRFSQEEVQFLHEYIGLSLTTEMKYETALWLVGEPGGGKSTFITGVETVAGQRCVNLSLASIQQSRFGLTNIVGKTVALSTEQPSGYMTATHILNSMISGERVTVEEKYRNPFDVYPKAKIIWAMNEKPRLPSGDNGLLRRIKVFPFPRVPIEARDLKLKDKIRGEGPGIFNLALKGLIRLNARGKFEIPRSVIDATAEYQLSNDIPAIFLQECCQCDPSAKVKAQELYNEYSFWNELTGHKAKSSTAVAEDWKRLGLERVKADGRHYWKGIQLKPRSAW